MSPTPRRQFLRQAGTLAVAGAAAVTGVLGNSRANAQTGKPMENVKALFFDVFGTLVDWRTGVARESKAILDPLGYKLDWIAFADAWRAEYQPGMEEIRAGRQPFSRLDVVHRGMLERIRPRFGLEKVSEPVLAELNLAWHKLDAWPDVPAAMKRLRTRYLIAPVSNGNIALMADLARRNGFHWDAILGAEIARDYKPKLRVYQVAAESLNLEHGQAMMCAAHSSDLAAAATAGLRTGFISQPDEYGKGTGEGIATVPVDAMAKNFTEFATMMGT